MTATDDGGRLRKGEWDVCPIPFSVCQSLVVEYHYAGGGSLTATHCHGLFRRGNYLRCLGAAWWLPPTKVAAVKAYPGGDFRRVASLSRLVVVPGVPKNAATFLIGRSIKLIAAEGRYRCLLTFADTWRGHTGAIYKATNWEEMGLTKPSPVFINAAGRMVSRKAGPKTRTKKQMEALGCHCAGYFPKYRFRILLPEPRRVAPTASLF